MLSTTVIIRLLVKDREEVNTQVDTSALYVTENGINSLQRSHKFGNNRSEDRETEDAEEEAGGNSSAYISHGPTSK